MNERGRNESDISRYTDVEYSPEGYKNVYRWGDFLEIAGGHAYNAMDTIDLVSTGGEYEGFNPRYAYTCEFVGCSTLVDGIALFRPVSRDGEDLTQIAFLRSDIDDDTGAYTECFEAGSFDIAAASDIQCSDLGIDLLDYFRGRSFEGLSGVKRGLDGREAVGAVEVATGCDLDLFEDFWLGSPGETDVHVGPYVKRDLIALSYIVNDFSQMYGTSARDIRKLLARVNNFHPDRLAAVKAYLDCEYVTDRDTSDEKTYCWSDFLEIAGGDARYAAMLIERTAPGEPQEGHQRRHQHSRRQVCGYRLRRCGPGCQRPLPDARPRLHLQRPLRGARPPHRRASRRGHGARGAVDCRDPRTFARRRRRGCQGGRR